MNNWQAIKTFYEQRHEDIMECASDDWALDPYEWENRGLLCMTPIEEWLWSDMRSEGMVMYPQYPVGGVFVDFGNPVAKVAIECDGAAYHLDKEKDAERDRRLDALGWVVYRFTGRECRSDFDEETMEPRIATQILRLICKEHRISRRRKDDGFKPIGNAIGYMLHRPAFRKLFESAGL
jgi:very-short-patch-repair endonuclease